MSLARRRHGGLAGRDRYGRPRQRPRRAPDPPHREHQPVRPDARRNPRRPRRSSRADGLLRAPKRPAADFFTAVEDLPQDGDSGSAHLQTAFLTTSLFYRFATINITDLHRNLGPGATAGTVKNLVELFVQHFILSMPSGKKTATAPHTVPDLVHYAVRERRSVSYGAAFERPVTAPAQGGYTVPARQALADYATAMSRLLGTRPLVSHGHTGTQAKPIKDLGSRYTSFDALAAACAAAATADLTPVGRP